MGALTGSLLRRKPQTGSSRAVETFRFVCYLDRVPPHILEDPAFRMLPDHDTAWIQFQVVNLEGFETVSVHFPAFEVGSQRLDELARWIVGEPNRFLNDGQNLRRVEY